MAYISEKLRSNRTLIKLLEQFPNENPNPIMRFDVSYELIYYNPASEKIVSAWQQGKKTDVPESFKDKLKLANNDHKANQFELVVGRQTFLLSAIYIEHNHFINVYGVDITELKMINKFPSYNPNPVMRISLDGQLYYYNKASQYIVDQWNISLRHNIPDPLYSHIKLNKEHSTVELDIGDRFFSFTIIPIVDFDFYILYGKDDTAIKENKLMVAKLSKYFSPQIFNSIFSGELDIISKANRKQLTVFFSDIHNFTSIADLLEAEQLTELITSYLTKMTQIAVEYGATVDKYIGDGIMIFFGDPNTKGVQEDAIACVSMALKMQQMLSVLRKQWISFGISQPLKVRIGIHSSMCTVGNFGSVDRLDYTAFGKGVNIASRLESAADLDQILMSDSTYNLVGKHIRCSFYKEIMLKGISHPIKTYTVDDATQYDSDDSLINVEEDGVSIFLDKPKITNKEKIIEQLQKCIEKLQ